MHQPRGICGGCAGLVDVACARRGEDPEATNAELKMFENAITRADVRYQATLVALELLLP